MHCTKILAEFEFGSHSPPGCKTPKVWRFAESWRITQNVNKAMRSNETSHRTHRAHRTCVRLRRWENPRRLSSCYSYFLHLLQKSALMQDASNALHVLMLGAKMMFCVTWNTDDDDGDIDLLSRRHISEIYYLWKLAGGDLEGSLRKAGLLRQQPPITQLPL